MATKEPGMFRLWMRVMPYAFVVWAEKRRLERMSVKGMDGYLAIQPFRTEVLMWKIESRA